MVAPSLVCQIIISQARRIIKWLLVWLREARHGVVKCGGDVAAVSGFCGERVSSAVEALKTSGSEHDSCNEEVEHGQDKNRLFTEEQQ